MERLTEYHSGVAVIKNKNMLSEAMKKLAAYEDVEEKTVTTNVERIRSMSDEDLAINMTCPNESGLGNIKCDMEDSCDCYECILKWLQSEVEE